MKRSKFMTKLGFLTLSAAFLASCSGYVKSKGHVVLRYGGQEYTAEELFGEQKTPAAAEAKFNAVYRVAVRTYFKGDDEKTKELNEVVERETKVKVEGQKSTARSNADKNGTSYDTEWQKILDSNNVEDESELYDKFEYDVQKEKFEDQFYDDNIDVLRSGGKFEEKGEKIEGYIPSKQPYHVKQILIKIAGGKDKDYTRCQITEAESEKISKVIKALASGTPFAEVARNYSDDTATKDKGGDLGIMDRDTSYVNDFKLGLYLYESFIGSSTKTSGGTYESKEAIKELGLDKTTTAGDTAADYANKIAVMGDPTGTKSGNIGIAQIPYEAALLLDKDTIDIADGNGTAWTTTTGYGKITYESQHFSKVSNVTDNANFYPRNVVFNKYFNKHNLMVITPSRNTDRSTTTLNTGETKRIKDDFYDIFNADVYKNLSGFKRTAKNNDIVLGYNDVLRDENGRVIFVFRSGNGTGEGSYQGIHFVVIERSPFIGKEYTTYGESSKEGSTSIDEYYTNYYPGQEGGKHPYFDDEKNYAKPTYVSYFANMEKADLATRANDVKTKIKGYNTNLNTYIYKYLKERGAFNFTTDAQGLELENTITEWIQMKRESTRYDAEKSWNDSWKAYYTELDYQNKYRTPVNIGSGDVGTENADLRYGTITEYCADKYANLNGETSGDVETIKKLFSVGGVFYE